MRKFGSALMLAACLAVGQSAPAAVVYRSGEGWTVEGEEGSAVEATAGAQMKKAEDFEHGGDLKRALHAYRGLVKKFPNAAVAPKAELKVGELNERLDDADR